MLYKLSDGGLEHGKLSYLEMVRNENEYNQQNARGRILARNPNRTFEINLLVDTGILSSFLSQTTVNWLTAKLGHKIQSKATKVGDFRCFNNNKIKINNTLNINITSGNTSATNCENLVVPHNTVKFLGRDILQKLGIHLL